MNPYLSLSSITTGQSVDSITVKGSKVILTSEGRDYTDRCLVYYRMGDMAIVPSEGTDLILIKSNKIHREQITETLISVGSRMEESCENTDLRNGMVRIGSKNYKNKSIKDEGVVNVEYVLVFLVDGFVHRYVLCEFTKSSGKICSLFFFFNHNVRDMTLPGYKVQRHGTMFAIFHSDSIASEMVGPMSKLLPKYTIEWKVCKSHSLAYKIFYLLLIVIVVVAIIMYFGRRRYNVPVDF